MAYVTRLTNGMAHDLTGQVGATGEDYSEDPYFNFQLPSNAINVRITLADPGAESETHGEFYGDDGWLMVQRGQQPSSNGPMGNPEVIWTDGRMGAIDGDDPGYQPPTVEGVFVLVVPEQQTLAGEWFVSLDMLTTLTGGSLLVEWDHDETVPPTLTDVAIGDNGSLSDAADFIFTIPANTSDNFSVAYWTFDVPAQSTLTVVLDDNADGDIVNSGGAVALILSIGDAYPSGSPTNELNAVYSGIAYQNVPIAVSWTNDTNTNPSNESVTVYINVGVRSPTGFSGARLMVNCVSGIQWLPNSDNVPTIGGDTPPPPTDWVVNYSALQGSGFDTSNLATTNDLLSGFSSVESNYAANFRTAFPSPEEATVSNQGYHAYARFTQTNGSTINTPYNNPSVSQGGISLICGFLPVYYPVLTSSETVTLLSPVNTGTFSQPSYPAILMAYERIAVSWERESNVGTPTWTSISREVTFVMVRAHDNPSYTSGIISRVDILDGGEVVSNGVDVDYPYIDQWLRTTIAGNDGLGTEVVEFGYDLTYTVGDEIPEGPDGEELRGLQMTLNSMPTYTYLINQDGDDIVRAQPGWTAYATTVFVDTTQDDGQLLANKSYFLGIKYTLEV